MQALGSIQSTVFLLVVVAIFVFAVVALISSLRFTDEVYRAADKRTKKFWTLMLGGAVFITILGFVATVVYWLDARPALRQVDRGRRNR
jgi:hypothetical protein